MIVSKMFFALLITTGFWSSDIYTYSVPKIEGGNQSLSAFTNKKLLIVTLPISQGASEDSLLYSLDTLSVAHQAELQVIAVPAFEDGYTVNKKTALLEWYRSKLNNSIIITDGLYIRKTSSQQHLLFQWLTKVESNQTFDIDIDGSGYKFFVNTNGELYGVLRPHTKMWSYSVNKVIAH